MEPEPAEPYGLRSISLDHQALFRSFFQAVAHPLSDYSFAATFMWREAIGLRWTLCRDHLCLFANGTGGLTLVAPPFGEGDFRAAVDEAVDLCRQFNLDRGWTGDAGIEYVSDAFRARFSADYTAEPLSGDYVYPTARLALLDTPDLHDKARACRRFVNRYGGRVEPLTPADVPRCGALLRQWHAQHADPDDPAGQAVRQKRDKDLQATLSALEHFQALNFKGLVLLAGDELIGFTLGEQLRPDTVSILVEKTDRAFSGSAPFIFREFCRLGWPDTPWCNTGDDWGIESLAWNKQSYRPAFRLNKWRLVPPPVRPGVQVAAPAEPCVERACLADLPALLAIERDCFTAEEALKRTQFRRFLTNGRAEVLVIRHAGQPVADAVLLVRRTPGGPVSRLYSLAVAPGFRGRGLGGALVDACIERSIRLGSRRVALEVRAANDPAIGLYLGKGFCPTRTLPDYYGPGQDGLKMHLALPPAAPAATAPAADRAAPAG